jgi:hypothetical protein
MRALLLQICGGDVVAVNRVVVERVGDLAVGHCYAALQLDAKDFTQRLGIDWLARASDTMSWQILSCGRPKPAAFSTILRSLTVGA